MQPTPAPAVTPAATVLAVDDDRTMLAVLEHMLQAQGYHVLSARSGEEALGILEKSAGMIDAMLLDREMPGLNGLQVVGRVKDHPVWYDLPIIMQTGSNRPEQIREGIEAGVFYYLTKPLQEDVLTSIVSAAVHEMRQQRQRKKVMQRERQSFLLMETGRFFYRTLSEAEALAGFLAHCFPKPERVLRGLVELMTNAVEHGNLGITYEEKTELLRQNRWRQEVTKRLEDPAMRDIAVEVVLKRKQDGIYVQITDQGTGFDWQRYLTVDPARAMDTHGRGIAQANLLSFDELQYNEKGNQVAGCVFTGPRASGEIAW